MLQTKNVNLIKRTVLRIPLRVVIPLLQEVTAAVESEPGKTAHSVAVCSSVKANQRRKEEEWIKMKLNFCGSCRPIERQ